MQSLSLPEHSVTRLDTVHCADALARLRGKYMLTVGRVFGRAA